MNTVIKSIAALLLASTIQPAFSADIAAGKVKSAMCIGCHGAEGVSPSEAFPNLAGQKATYTSLQLQAFKAGTRNNPMMSGMAKPLSDEDIANLAAYYASLKP